MNTPIAVVESRSRESRELAPAPREVTPMDLLRIAASTGASLEQLEKYMDLQQRWQKDQARAAYASAMVDAHRDPPQITKNKHVNRGNAGSYNHATHDEVTLKVGQWLAKYGFSHAWRREQRENLIHVTCVITHQQGHSESFTLYGPPDTTGSKSPLQAIASSTTFLERYTLLGGAGLSTSEQRAADDDATSGSPREPDPEGYADFQAAVEALADERRLEGLNELWGKASPAIRRHCTRYDGVWWTDERARAEGKA